MYRELHAPFMSDFIYWVMLIWHAIFSSLSLSFWVILHWHAISLSLLSLSLFLNTVVRQYLRSMDLYLNIQPLIKGINKVNHDESQNLIELNT